MGLRTSKGKGACTEISKCRDCGRTCHWNGSEEIHNAGTGGCKMENKKGKPRWSKGERKKRRTVCTCSAFANSCWIKYLAGAPKRSNRKSFCFLLERNKKKRGADVGNGSSFPQPNFENKTAKHISFPNSKGLKKGRRSCEQSSYVGGIDKIKVQHWEFATAQTPPGFAPQPRFLHCCSARRSKIKGWFRTSAWESISSSQSRKKKIPGGAFGAAD